MQLLESQSCIRELLSIDTGRILCQGLLLLLNMISSERNLIKNDPDSHFLVQGFATVFTLGSLVEMTSLSVSFSVFGPWVHAIVCMIFVCKEDVGEGPLVIFMSPSQSVGRLPQQTDMHNKWKWMKISARSCNINKKYLLTFNGTTL